MAFTVADAIRTWDTAGPANNLRQGYALGLQRAQAQDAAIRDRQRLEFEAVRLAEQQKTSDFNRVFDQLKFAEEKKQFQQQQQLREQVYGRQLQNDRFEQGMISRGINPNTGVRNSSLDAALYPPGYGPSGSDASSLPAIPASSSGSTPAGFVPLENPQDPSMTNTGPESGLFPGDVVEEPVAPVGNTITAPPGEVINVLTDMPGNPGVVTDTTLVEGPPPSVGMSFGNLPQIAASLAPESSQPPEPVSEMDRILQGLRGRQSEILTAAEAASGEAKESANAAMEARSMARSRQLSPDARAAWMDFGSKEARTAGESQARAVKLAADLRTAQEEEKALEARRPVVEAISTLRGVLPADQLREVEASALAKKPSATAVTKLTELENYAAARQANDWTHQSRGVETARAVGRAYAAMNDPRFAESRQANVEAELIKPELDSLNTRLDSLKGSAKTAAEVQQKELAARYAKLNSEGLLFRGRVAAYDAARKADVKGELKAAAPTPAAIVTPPAPAAAASKPAPGKSLVMDWIETVRKTTPAPVAGPTGARPGIDFPVNRGY